MSNLAPFSPLLGEHVFLLDPAEAKSGRTLLAGTEGVVVAEMRAPHIVTVRLGTEFVELAREQVSRAADYLACDDCFRTDGTHNLAIEH